MIESYEEIAFNQAPDSDNEIHSDEMAQRFGLKADSFRGNRIGLPCAAWSRGLG